MRLAPTTRLLLIAVGAAVVAAPWAVVARTLVDAKPVALNSGSARSIVWGGRVFSKQADLAKWLRSRGASYSVWAELHPGDRAILEHTTKPAASGGGQAAGARAGGTATSTTASRSRKPPASAESPATTASGSSVSWLRIALLALASLSMLAALLPTVAPVSGEDISLTATHRAYLFAAGFSVSVGVLVAGVLS